MTYILVLFGNWHLSRKEEIEERLLDVNLRKLRREHIDGEPNRALQAFCQGIL